MYDARRPSTFVAAPERLALIHYESLVLDPMGTVEALYDRLKLAGFPAVRTALAVNISRRGGIRARNAAPPAEWNRRLRIRWRSIFEQYGYDP